jgi:hypothetical protein
MMHARYRDRFNRVVLALAVVAAGAIALPPQIACGASQVDHTGH